MTEAEIESLVFLVASSAPVPVDEVGLFLCDGYVGDHVRNMRMGHANMASLVAQGAARRVARQRYAATEKGRIAAALALAKRPEMTEIFFGDD